MQNSNLDESAFQALGPSVTGAFLPIDDATSDVVAAYGSTGLRGEPDGQRRVARVVTVPAGTQLFKLTKWEEKWERDLLSPWWSTATPFEEDTGSAEEVFKTAMLNGVSLREYVRFASAVTIDWNLLDFYVGITLATDVGAFWGQFAPQAGRAGDPQGATVTEEPGAGGDDTFVHYGSSPDARSEVYLPDVLGGVGAWQLYIPQFSKQWIDPASIVNIASVDSAALAHHLGVSAEEMQRLHDASAPVRKD